MPIMQIPCHQPDRFTLQQGNGILSGANLITEGILYETGIENYLAPVGLHQGDFCYQEK